MIPDCSPALLVFPGTPPPRLNLHISRSNFAFTRSSCLITPMTLYLLISLLVCSLFLPYLAKSYLFFETQVKWGYFLPLLFKSFFFDSLLIFESTLILSCNYLLIWLLHKNVSLLRAIPGFLLCYSQGLAQNKCLINKPYSNSWKKN